MTLDSLPDLDTSGLCLVKTLSTALTCWPYRNTALRDGARTSTRTSSVAKGRTASIHTSRACKARWRSRGSDDIARIEALRAELRRLRAEVMRLEEDKRELERRNAF